MTTPKDVERVSALPEQSEGSTRRSFIQKASLAGAGIAGLGGLLSVMAGEAKAGVRALSSKPNPALNDFDFEFPEGRKGDKNILIAAEIAEALAVTTYTNIINTSPFFGNLPNDDQGYLVAARQEEMSHYLLEQSVTDEPSPFTTFFYPPNMFADPQTTLNTLVTLEDAFIAAYLVGVRNFSSPDLRVTAARIMGIESDHRTLARVLCRRRGPARRRPDRKHHRLRGRPRKRRSTKQQRLRANQLLESNRPSSSRSNPVR